MKKFLCVLLPVIMLTGCSNSGSSDREFEVGYSVFPISYADSNGDGKGDINGITAKLDYIQGLGIDTIWINPVHESPSYHKYDVVDYYSIDDDFGTMEDYETLIKEAHKRDINVVMDFVINHTSSQHEWFKNAISSEDSEYRDYYRFYDFADGNATYSTKDGWVKLNKDTYYFASFWSEMPELNYENEKVTEEMYKIADFWMDKGVDGFRIDAVKHLYDPREYPKGTPTLKNNFEWFENFKAHIEEKNPNAFVIGEVYDEYQAVTYYYGGFDALFNFSVAEQIQNAVITETNVDLNKVFEKSKAGQVKYNENASEAYFITNHDQDRIMSRLKGDTEKAKLAGSILLTLPGMSWVYYGEEIGMQGEGKDEYKREPINWGDEYTTKWESVKYNTDITSVNEQVNDENSLYSTYKELIALKKENDVLYKGTFEGVDSEKNMLAYKVYDEDETLLVVHNLSGQKVNCDYEYSSVLYDSGFADGTLEPYSTVVLKQK